VLVVGVVACGDNIEPFALGFPVRERALIDQLIGMDHDPVVQDEGLAKGICKNFRGLGFPTCYDEHRGSDFILAGGFETMDSGSATVVAAADGVVVGIRDHEYDRCHIEGTQVSCDGYPMRANYVTIEHVDGLVTRYLHLKKESVAVEVGESVSCGTPLGLIGSSGLSSFPHLHFELQMDGTAVDPYAGELSQDESFWHEQYVDYDPWPGPGCAGL